MRRDKKEFLSCVLKIKLLLIRNYWHTKVNDAASSWRLVLSAVSVSTRCPSQGSAPGTTAVFLSAEETRWCTGVQSLGQGRTPGHVEELGSEPRNVPQSLGPRLWPLLPNGTTSDLPMREWAPRTWNQLLAPWLCKNLSRNILEEIQTLPGWKV